MSIQKDQRWDFHFPLYNARFTLPNEKPLFSMSPADERERQHRRKWLMGRRSYELFQVVDTAAPLAYSFECNPWDMPDQLFVPTNNWGLVPQTRLVHIADDATVLVQTDGACRDNGRPNAMAASAVVYAPYNPLAGTEGAFSAQLWNKRDATSNRAEMIAVLAAIRCRNWKAEGFNRLVIGTDSEWILKAQRFWNIEANRHNGLEVLFWRLDRSLNGRADAAAKCEVNEMVIFVNRRAEAPAKRATFVKGFSHIGVIRERYQ